MPFFHFFKDSNYPFDCTVGVYGEKSVGTRELKFGACHSSQSSLSVYRAFSVTQSTGPFAVCCVRALTIKNKCWPAVSCA